MELVEGTDLAHYLREKGPLTLDRALTVARQVAAALDAAQAGGIVHRDIKPENILLDVNGTAKVTDFGIARALEESSGTRTGTIIGTAEYMAPEQALGKPVDGRSDVYSLACVVYEMLSGSPPFGRAGAERSAISIVHDHAHTPIPEVRSPGMRLPRGVEQAVARALDKQAEKRYATAGEFVAALQAAAQPGGVRRARAEIGGTGTPHQCQLEPDAVQSRERGFPPRQGAIAWGKPALVCTLLVVLTGGIVVLIHARGAAVGPPPAPPGYLAIPVPAGANARLFRVSVVRAGQPGESSDGLAVHQVLLTQLAGVRFRAGAYSVGLTYRGHGLKKAQCEVMPDRQTAIPLSRPELAKIEYQQAMSLKSRVERAGCLRRVLQLAPEHVEANLILAAYAVDANRPEEAKIYLQAVLRRAPDNRYARLIGKILKNRQAVEMKAAPR